MRVIMFGSGENLLNFLGKKQIFHHFKIVGIVDNDKRKHGEILHTRHNKEFEISSPDILNEADFDKVIITTHYHAIRGQLKDIYKIPEEKILDLKDLENKTLKGRILYARHVARCLCRKKARNRKGTISQPIYVITPPFRDGFRHQGLGQIENHVLGHCIYAADKGWIPVVDLKTYSCMYQDPDELGNVNIWEKYYRQPAGYSLDDLPKAKKAIYSADTPWIQSYYKKDLELRKRSYKKYIFLRKELEDEINAEWERLTCGKKRILGCVCRGTDVIGLNWENDFPPIDAIISHLEKIKDGYDRIYLATEDQDMYEKMVGHFGDGIISYSQQRYKVKEGKYLFEYEDARENARYIRGKEYLFVLEMLARCTAVTGMVGTATAIASLKNPELDVIRVQQ